MTNGRVCVTGDVHGHLQLALGVAARWQKELDSNFEAVLICGDIGSFARVEDLDKATRRHAKNNPDGCDLEFTKQWMHPERAPWLAKIWESEANGGLGLEAPCVITYGNHEGFDLIRKATPNRMREEPVELGELRAIDPDRRILLLPSGWRLKLPSGIVIGSVGGIQPGQRHKAGYDEMAYIQEKAVESIAVGEPMDVLITHQGPRATQGFNRGSDLLDRILETGKAKTWFHGHSVGDPEIKTIGNTTVVPLNGVPFRPNGPMEGQPDEDAWCSVDFSEASPEIDRQRPDCWWEFHRRNWSSSDRCGVVMPQLSSWI